MQKNLIVGLACFAVIMVAISLAVSPHGSLALKTNREQTPTPSLEVTPTAVITSNSPWQKTSTSTPSPTAPTPTPMTMPTATPQTPQPPLVPTPTTTPSITPQAIPLPTQAPTTSQQLTLLFQSGWENSNGTDATDGNLWRQYGGSVIENTTYSGKYAFESSTKDHQFVYQIVNSSQTLRISAQVCFQSLPTNGDRVSTVWIRDDNTNCEVVVDAADINGTVVWRVSDNVQGVSSDIPVDAGKWYNVTCQGIAGSPFTYSVWIDSEQIATNQHNGSYACSSLNEVGVGGCHKNESVTVYVDDVKVSSIVISS